MIVAMRAISSMHHHGCQSTWHAVPSLQQQLLWAVRAHIHGRAVGGCVGLLKHLLALRVQGVIHGLHALGGDDLGDGACTARLLRRQMQYICPLVMCLPIICSDSPSSFLKCCTWLAGWPREPRGRAGSQFAGTICPGTSLQGEAGSIEPGMQVMASRSTCDAFNAVAEGLILGLALMPEAPEQALHHAVHRAQQHAALPVDVAPVLALQRGACMAPASSGRGC